MSTHLWWSDRYIDSSSFLSLLTLQVQRRKTQSKAWSTILTQVLKMHTTIYMLRTDIRLGLF